MNLRKGRSLLGTVEKCNRLALKGGRYKPFRPDVATLAKWPSDKHTALGAPPRAHFIVNYPDLLLFISSVAPWISALTEYERNPM